MSYKYFVQHYKDHSHPNCFGNVSEYPWTDAFFNSDLLRFKKIMGEDVTHYDAGSPYAFQGSDRVADNFSWASDFYHHCDFIYQANTRNVSFIEYHLLTKNNMKMQGVTVLTKNDDNKITKIFNGHRDLEKVLIHTARYVKAPFKKHLIELFHNNALSKYGVGYRYPRDANNISSLPEVSERDLVTSIKMAESSVFQELLNESVSFISNYITDRIIGSEDVSECLALIFKFYQYFSLTSQAVCGNRTYLSYNGRLRNGLTVEEGVLVIVRNRDGEIIEISDNVYPIHSGTIISHYLSHNVSNKNLSINKFYHDKVFSNAVKKYGLKNVYGNKTIKHSYLNWILIKMINRYLYI